MLACHVTDLLVNVNLVNPTIQIHIQVVTLVLHNQSETTPHICRMQLCHHTLRHVAVTVNLYLHIRKEALSVWCFGKGSRRFLKHCTRCGRSLSWWNLILLKSSPLAAW